MTLGPKINVNKINVSTKSNTKYTIKNTNGERIAIGIEF